MANAKFVFYQNYSLFEAVTPNQNDISDISQGLFFPWVVRKDAKRGIIVWVLDYLYAGYITPEILKDLDCDKIMTIKNVKKNSIPRNLIKNKNEFFLNDKNWKWDNIIVKKITEIIVSAIHQDKEDCWFWSPNVLIWTIIAHLPDKKLPFKWDDIKISEFISLVKGLYMKKGNKYWKYSDFTSGGYNENATVRLLELYFGVKGLPIIKNYDKNPTTKNEDYIKKQTNMLKMFKFGITSHFFKKKHVIKSEDKFKHGDIINIGDKRHQEDTYGHAVMYAAIEDLINLDAEKNHGLHVPDKVKAHPEYYFLVKDTSGALNYHYVNNKNIYCKELLVNLYVIPWQAILLNDECINHFVKFYKETVKEEDEEETVKEEKGEEKKEKTVKEEEKKIDQQQKHQKKEEIKNENDDDGSIQNDKPSEPKLQGSGWSTFTDRTQEFDDPFGTPGQLCDGNGTNLRIEEEEDDDDNDE